MTRRSTSDMAKSVRSGRGWVDWSIPLLPGGRCLGSLRTVVSEQMALAPPNVLTDGVPHQTWGPKAPIYQTSPYKPTYRLHFRFLFFRPFPSLKHVKAWATPSKAGPAGPPNDEFQTCRALKESKQKGSGAVNELERAVNERFQRLR